MTDPMKMTTVELIDCMIDETITQIESAGFVVDEAMLDGIQKLVPYYADDFRREMLARMATRGEA